MSIEKAPVITPRESIRNILGLFRQARSEHPWALGSVLILSLISAVIPSGQIWLQKMVVDRLTQLQAPSGAALMPLLILITAQYFSSVGISLLGIGQTYASALIRIDLTYHLQKLVGLRAEQLPLRFFEQNQLYDQLQHARQGTQDGPNVLEHVIGLGHQLISLLSILAILYFAHWSLPFALLLASIPGIGVMLLVKRQHFTAHFRQMPEYREADYTYQLLMSRESAKELRIFGLGGYLIERWSKLYQALRGIQLRLQIREALAGVLGQIIMAVASTLIAGFMAWQISAGSLRVGDYVALTAAVLSVQGAIGRFAMTLGQIFERLLTFNAVYAFLGQEADREQQRKAPFPAPLRRGIKVTNLTFAYPGARGLVLKDLSFEIKQGEKVAIVGANGSGKTTLVLCLLGLFEPTSGSIYYDDINIADLSPTSLQQNVTAVFQDFMRYRYTLRENVGFGHVSAMSDPKWLAEAAQQAGIMPLVEQLSAGWDTMLGRYFRQGEELSGGQWQRIAIARAFMRRAQVIAVDEPTASLDPHAELEVFHRFATLTAGKTSLMISHRLGPARYADRILVLKDGCLVEEGTHHDLLACGGEYSQMFRSQASWYQD